MPGPKESRGGLDDDALTSLVPSSTGDSYQSEETTIDRLLRQFKSGLFGVLFIMSKETHISTPFALIMVTMHFIQMLQFPLSDLSSFPWNNVPSMHSVANVLDLVSMNHLAARISPSLSVVAFYMCLIWIVAIVVAAVWCGYSFSQKSFRVLWPLKFLRFGAQITTTVLFIPMTHILLGIFSCPGVFWEDTSWACWGHTHMTFVVIVLTVMPLFACLSFIVVATFFDRDPTSKNIEAKAHGRVAVAMLGIKVVLVLLFTLAIRFNPIILAVACLLAGVGWFGLHFYFLPFYSHGMNCLEASMGLLMAWTSACLIMGIKIVDKGNAAFAFWSAAPFVAFFGYQLVQMRLPSVMKAAEFTSPFLLEMRVRIMLQESGDSPETLAQVDKLFELAMQQLSSSSMVHIIFAAYLQRFKKNRPLEMAQLAAAERKEPALDEYFLIYQRRRQVEETESTTGSSRMNVITRVAFEKHMAESRLHSLQAREKQVLFWNELLEKEPDIGRLHQVGVDLNESITKAEMSYGQLLRINPQSVTVLRSYAQFLIEVVNHDAKAAQLLDEADRIEDNDSKRHQMAAVNVVFFQEGDSLDGSSENTGLITISAKPETLGQINSLNTTALKMYGYTNRDIVGRNISSLVPEPFASVHNKFLEAYLQSGKEYMLNATRIVFGLNSSGAIFPMYMAVKAMQPGFGALVQPISTEEGFIMFIKSSGVITGCCTESFGLLEELVDSPMSASIACVVEMRNIPKDRHASGTFSISAKFQVVPVPTLSEKVVVLRWHPVGSVSGAGKASSHAGDSHVSEHRKHDSVSHSVKSHVHSLVTAGVSTPPHRPTPDKATESAEDKHKLRFNMAAERRYSITAKPLHEPIPTTQVVVLQPVRKGSRPIVVGDRDDGVDDGYYVDSDGQPIKKSRDAVVPLAETHSSAQGGTVSTTAALLAMKPSRLFNKPTPAGDVEAVHGAAEPQVPTKRHKRKDRRRVHPMDGLTETESCSPKDDSAVLEVPAPAPSSSANLLDALRLQTGSSSEGDNTDSDTISDDDDSLDGGVGSGTDADKTPAAAPSDDVLDATAASFPARRRRSSLTRRHMQFQRQTSGNIPTVSDTAAPGPVVAMQPDTAPEEDEERTISSATSQDTALQALRKSMERKQMQLDPGLEQLRRCFAWIFLFTGATNIVIMIVVRMMLTEHTGLITDMQLSGQRQVLIQEACTDLQHLLLMHSGWVSPALENATRTHMTAVLADIEVIHNNLYLSSDSVTYAPQADLYNSRTIIVEEIVGTRTVLRGLNLLELGVEFVQQARKALTLPLPRLTAEAPSVKYVMINGPYVVQYAFNASSALLLAQLDNQYNTMSKVQGMVLMSVIMLFDLILITAVVPIVRKIESNKDKILKIFLDVPIVVVRYLKQRCQDRLEILTELEGDNELPPGELIYEDDKARDWSTTNFKVRRRVFRKSLKLYFYLLLKFAGPAFGIVCYLTMMYLWDTIIMDSIQFAKNNAYYTQQRRVLTHMFDFHVRDIVTSPWPETGYDVIQASANLTTAINQQVLDVENGLMFGNYYWNLPGTLSQDAAQSNLMLTNGCAGSAALANCSSFANGLMSNGLHGALLEYQREGMSILSDYLLLYTNTSVEEHVYNVTFVWDTLEFLDTMTTSYLSDGLTASADMLISGTSGTLSTYAAWLVALSISSIVGLFVFYTMGYRPAILQMDKDMRRTRAMLLMFPDEVINGVERIRNLLREITVQMQQ